MNLTPEQKKMARSFLARLEQSRIERGRATMQKPVTCNDCDWTGEYRQLRMGFKPQCPNCNSSDVEIVAATIKPTDGG